MDLVRDLMGIGSGNGIRETSTSSLCPGFT